MWVNLVSTLCDVINRTDMSEEAYWAIDRAARQAGINRQMYDSDVFEGRVPPSYVDVAMHGVDDKAYAENYLDLYASSLLLADANALNQKAVQSPEPQRAPPAQNTFGSSLKDAY